MPFAVRRARHSAASLGAVAFVTAVAAASVSVVWALAGHAYDAGVDRMVAQSDPRDRSVVVTMPLTDDADAEATALADAIGDAVAGQPADVTTARLATAQTDTGGVSLELLSDPGAPARAELAAGAWPDGPDEVALAEPAAARLDAAVGDTLSLTGAGGTGDGAGGDLRVVGVWRAVDPADPAWGGDPAVASGMTGDAIGPAIVHDDDALAGLPRLRTRVTVAADELTVASASGLLGAVNGVASVPESAAGETGAGPAVVDGGLAGTLARALSAVAGARVALLVPLAALALVAAIIVGVIVFALGRARADELALVIARGAARRSVWAGMIGEIATAGAAGGLVGAVAASFVAAPLDALAVGAIAAATATAIGAAVSAGAVARATRGPVRRSRPATVTMLVVTLALGAAAALAVAQAITHGGLVQPGGVVDPLAVAAPWLVLATLAVGLTLLAGPAAAGAERLSRRSRGFAARFGVLQLARRPHSVLAGVLCLVLGAAGLALSGALAVGVAAGDAAAAAATGADLRVEVDVPAALDERNPALPVDELRDATGIAAVAPAVSAPAAVGDAALRLLALSPAGFAGLGNPEATAAQLARLGGLEAPPLTGDTLTVEVTATGPQGAASSSAEEAEAATPSVVVTAWALDDDGAPVRIDLGAAPADGSAHVLEAQRGTATRLLSVDIAGRNVPEKGLSVSARIADTAGPIALDAASATLSGTRAARLSATDLPETVPAVITAALAAAVDAPVGGILHLDIRGTTRDVAVEVTAIVPSIAGIGAGAGAAVDAGTLSAALVAERSAVLIPATFFVTADAAPAAATTSAAEASVRGWATHPVRIERAADAGARPVSTPTLALTAAAAVVGALLGIVGFAAVFAGAARDRRAEAVPLRSFGFDLAAQRRARLVERLSAALYALVAGALAGAITAVIVAPLLLPSLTGAGS